MSSPNKLAAAPSEAGGVGTAFSSAAPISTPKARKASFATALEEPEPTTKRTRVETQPHKEELTYGEQCKLIKSAIANLSFEVVTPILYAAAQISVGTLEDFQNEINTDTTFPLEIEPKPTIAALIFAAWASMSYFGAKLHDIAEGLELPLDDIKVKGRRIFGPRDGLIGSSLCDPTQVTMLDLLDEEVYVAYNQLDHKLLARIEQPPKWLSDAVHCRYDELYPCE
jgi:hypothetical protein